MTKIRVTLLEAPRFDSPDVKLADLDSVELDINGGRMFTSTAEEGIQRLDPEAKVVGYWAGEHGRRQLGWAVRRIDVDPSTARVSDFEEPPLLWQVDEQGELHMSLGYTLLRRDAFTPWLIAAAESGYNPVDWNDILLWEIDGGRGGDGPGTFDLIAFLLDHGVDIAVGTMLPWATKQFRKVFRTRRLDSEARKLAQNWERHGIGSPFVIRRWFDSKESWHLNEVVKRLKIAPQTGADLFKALGYGVSTDGSQMWRISAHKKAVERRQKWMKSETSVQYDQGQL